MYCKHAALQTQASTNVCCLSSTCGAKCTLSWHLCLYASSSLLLLEHSTDDSFLLLLASVNTGYVTFMQAPFTGNIQATCSERAYTYSHSQIFWLSIRQIIQFFHKLISSQPEGKKMTSVRHPPNNTGNIPIQKNISTLIRGILNGQLFFDKCVPCVKLFSDYFMRNKKCMVDRLN